MNYKRHFQFSIFNSHFKKGFTLIEVLVVTAIAGLLLSFVFINTAKPQSTTALTSGVNVLISDLRLQQLKSMAGETGILEASPSGVFFGSTSYTLYPDNFTITLGKGLRFSSVSLPNAEVQFATGSGEIVSFTPGSDSVTLQWNNGVSKTIKLNRYGSATQIN